MTAHPAVRERGILFSAPLVRALLAGTKTVTRRLAKFVPLEPGLNLGFTGLSTGHYDTGRPSSGHVLYSRGRHDVWQQRTKPLHCQFGVPGDRLYVKETHGIVYDCPDLPCACEEGATLHRRVVYRASEPEGLADYCESFDSDEPAKWKPSIFMRRADSRIDLEVTGVSVERLQSITEEEAKAEGVPIAFRDLDGNLYQLPDGHRLAFARKWDELHGAGSWASNPWVWRIGFRVLRPARAEEGTAAP